MKEYEMLRQEILDNSQIIAQYNALLYTVTVAILAFSFEKESPFLCLVPYVAIIPIYLLAEEQRKTTARIASYMIVFLEANNNEHQWETRLYKKTITRESESVLRHIFNLNRPSKIPYLFVSFVCSICAICKAIISNSTNSEKCLLVILILIPTVFTTVIMARNAKRYAHMKRSYIKQWQAIKDAEEAQKRNANRNPQ